MTPLALALLAVLSGSAGQIYQDFETDSPGRVEEERREQQQVQAAEVAPVSRAAEQQDLLLLFEEADLVVTPLRVPVKTYEAPSIVSVVTAGEIRAMGARTLLDILKNMAGIEVSRSILGFYRVGMRGIRSDAEVLLLVDGRRLNNPYDGLPLYDIGAANIERVEVLRGPGSAQYGTSALLGIISVTTRKQTGVRASASGGSFDTGRADIVAGTEVAGFRVSGFAEFVKSRGPRLLVQEDALKGTDYTLAPGKIWDPKVQAVFNLKVSQEKLLLPEDALEVGGSYFYEKRGPYIGEFDTLARDSELRWDIYDVSLKYELRPGRRTTVAVSLYRNAHIAQRLIQQKPDGYDPDYTGGLPAFPDGMLRKISYTAATNGAEAQFRVGVFEGNALLGGIQAERVDIADFEDLRNYRNEQYMPGVLANHGNLRFEQDGKARWCLSPYLQDQWTIAKAIHLTVGARYDYFSDVKGSLNPRAGLVWEFLERTYMKLLFATAFRAPTFEELYDTINYQTKQTGGVRGNPELGPEKIRSFEAGLEKRYTYEGLGFDLKGNAFFNQMRDLIYAPVVRKTGGNNYENAGENDVLGFELEASIRLSERTHTSANYSFFRGKDKTSDTYLTELPQYRLNLLAAIALGPHLNFGASLQMGEERRNNARTTLERLHYFGIPAYTLVNLSLSTEQLWGHVNFFASVFNLTDYAYLDDAPRPDRVTGNLPWPGRSFWGGVRAEY